jgi:peptidoglycan/xylan/chitin deacetylase (PgdA/CDA1 family)
MFDNPVPWPNGARCAAAITFDMDTDSALHLTHADAYKRVGVLSWLRYDEVAVPRISKMLNRYGVKGTFFVPAWCIERYPTTVQAVLDNGHELAHHGYLHESSRDQTREGELYWLQRGIEIIKRFCGKRPTGWRAPYANYSEHSTALLAQEGFLYDSSLMGDSYPYILRAAEGDVIELPIDWTMDDWPHYAHAPDFGYLMPISAPEKAMEVYMAEFEAAYEYGSLWITIWHPFVTGRPARLAAVAKMIEYMQKKGDVWFASMEEVAQHVQQCIRNGIYKPRIVSMPYYTGPIPELTEGTPKHLVLRSQAGWGSSG